METSWYIEILSADYASSFWGDGHTVSDRDDAQEYSCIDDAAEDYAKLCQDGYDAEICTVQRVARFSHAYAVAAE